MKKLLALTSLALLALVNTTACTTPVLDEPATGADEAPIVTGTLEQPQDAGYVRLNVGGTFCTATVVRTDWLLTNACINPNTEPGWVHVDMGALQTAAVAIVRHPTLTSIALVRLANTIPFTPRVLGSMTGAQLANAELQCHGFTVAQPFPRNGNFFVNPSVGTVHTIRDARRLANAVFVGVGDHGGPCELASAGIRGPVQALVFESKPTCVGGVNCTDGSVVRVDGFRTWVDDMISFHHGRRFSLRNPFNNQCWDIPWGSFDHGVRVNQFPCNFADNQKYVTGSVAGNNTHVTIVNVRSGKCVEVTEGQTGDRALLRQATCNGSARQLWLPVKVGAHWSFKPASETNKCVDIPNGTWAPQETQLQLGGCHGGSNQVWSQVL